MRSDEAVGELVRRAQDGERESLDRLAAEMERKVRQFVGRHFSFENNAVDDLVQEVNLQVLRSLYSCSRPERFWPWVYRITRNHINNYFRKRFVEKTRCMADMETLENRWGGRQNPKDGLERLYTRDLTERLRLALAFLPAEQRGVLLLRYYERMKYSEIARAIDNSLDQVRMKLHRGKEILKKQVFCCEADPTGLLETLGRMQRQAAGEGRGYTACEGKLLWELVEELPCLVYMKDENSIFSYSNPATARSFGLAAGEALLGRTDFDFMPRCFCRKLFHEEQEIMQSGRGVLNRGLWVDFDPEKTARFSLCTKIPWRDEQGKVVGILGCNRYVNQLSQFHAGKNDVELD